jgi:hypothetical protein
LQSAAGINRTYLSKLEKGASYPRLEIIAKRAAAPDLRLREPDRAALQSLADLVPQSAKADGYQIVIVIGSAHRLHRLHLRFPNGYPLAFAAQLFHAGADGMEVVGSSGVSHVSSPLGSSSVPVRARFWMVPRLGSRDKFSAPLSEGFYAVLTPF